MRRHAAIVGAVLVLLSLGVVVTSRPVLGDTTAPTRPNDFDGNGFTDLAVGVPGEAIGTKRDAGSVNVLYGGSNGLGASRDQGWSQDSPGVLGTSEGRTATTAGDGFGSALASSDFDLDGHSDLAVGVPSESIGSTRSAGAVNVLYGSSSGLTAAGNELWQQQAPAAGAIFGHALAAGDFDGDSYGDLAIGSPGTKLGAGQSPGSVTIVHGGPGGLSTAGATLLTRAMAGVSYGSMSPNGFGAALETGDFDGDGYADLAVGTPASGVTGDDPTRPLVQGEVSIFYGGPTGLTASGSQTWTQGGLGLSTAVGDWFGASLASGDFDEDGHADLAIGARFDLVSGLRGGAVDVLYGGPTGLSATGKQRWHQDRPGVPGVVKAGDDFGRALATGNLGFGDEADLAIGVPGDAVGSTAPGAGVVDVLFGSPTGLTATSAQAWSQASPGVPGTPEATDIAWDAFGASLAVGGYGRSPAEDLAVGVPLEGIGSRLDAGMVEVLYGSGTGLSSSGVQGWTQDSPGITGASEAHDRFGASLSH